MQRHILGVPAPCPGGCECTILEHLAFDAGLSAAGQGVAEEACPLSGLLGEAWLTGYSVVACAQRLREER